MPYAALKACMLFPAIHFIGLLLGCCIYMWSPKVGKWMAIFAMISLYVCATPWGERLFASSLEDYPLFSRDDLDSKAQAIVVLDSRGSSYEQNRRLSLAVSLHKAYGLPIIVSGRGGAHSLAYRLHHIYKVPVAYVDNESSNTWHHAQTLKPYLEKHKLESFYLLAHSWHMKRALWTFEYQGLHPIPLIANTPPQTSPFHWIPSIRSLTHANYAYYEHIGLTWYRIKAFWLANVAPEPR